MTCKCGVEMHEFAAIHYHNGSVSAAIYGCLTCYKWVAIHYLSRNMVSWFISHSNETKG